MKYTIKEAEIYLLPDVAEKLNISVRTLRQYIREGKLKANKIGRAYYVTKANLMAFVEGEET